MQSEILKELLQSSLAPAAQFSGGRFSPFGKPKTNKQRRNENQKKCNFLEEIIDVQEILYSFSTSDQVCRQFLNGLNGAPQLSMADIHKLRLFHALTTLAKHPQNTKFDVSTLFSIPDENQFKASKHFSLLMEGSKENVAGENFSYAEGRSVVRRVLDCGYFSEIRRKNNAAQMEKEKLEKDKKLFDSISQKTILSNATANVIGVNLAESVLGEKRDRMIGDTFMV